MNKTLLSILFLLLTFLLFSCATTNTTTDGQEAEYPVVLSNVSKSENLGSGKYNYYPMFVFNQDVYLDTIILKKAVTNFQSQVITYDYKGKLIKKGEEVKLPVVNLEQVSGGIFGWVYFTITVRKVSNNESLTFTEVSK